MLYQDLRENELIKVKVSVQDWKEAIRKGIDLLEAAGRVESRYYQAIIDKTEEIGPYYLIAPGIAMPHSRPEDGVIKASISIVTLATPVAIGESPNNPVHVLISLAAISNDGHLDMIREIVTALSKPGAMEQMIHAESEAEILELFNTEEPSE